MPADTSIIGQRFGRLVVVNLKVDGKRSLWTCRCDCGGQRTTRRDALTSGATKSCGCLPRWRITHGQCRGNAHSPAYKSWQMMIQRCHNPKFPRYAEWGGRGIEVCDRWRLFANFYADMGARPTGMTLDREDNDGHYEPLNCRWATPKEQYANRRVSYEQSRSSQP